MNHDDRSDRDVRPRRRRGAYAAGLSAAVGAALAAAMIPAAPAFADPTDDAAPAIMISPDAILNEDINTFFGDLQDPSLAGPDIQLTDFLLSFLPGGVTGTDGAEVETLLVNDFYGPLIDALGGGGMRMLDAAAADAVPAAKAPTEEAILNGDITRFFDDLQAPSLAGPDIQVTDSLLGLLPGGGGGTDAIEVETLLVTDIYTPLIELLGGGGMAF